MAYNPPNPNGQATSANSQPVVLASDQSAVPITDNSGSVTVDAPVATPVFVRLSDGAAAITALPVTDNAGSITVDAPVGTPAFVRLSDGSSAITTLPVSLASVPSHAVTVASGGIASGAVASGAFASGSIAAGAVAAGATSFVKLEDVASADADAGVPAMAVRKATPANTSGTDGDYEMLQISAGRLWASATIDAALPAGTNVIGKVSIDQTTPGTTNLVALAANQSVNVAQINGVATTMGNGVSGTGVQRVTIASDSTGQVALATGTNSVGKISDITTSVVPGTGATNLGKAEDAGHTTGDTGVMVLAVRNDTIKTAPTNTDADYSQISVDDLGRVLATVAPAATMVRGTANTTGTSDVSLVAASGDASLRTYITDLQFANTGSSTTLITVKDGNAGSTLLTTICPTLGGSNIHLTVPIVTTANTALYFACATGSTTVYASAQGFKMK